MLMRTPPRWVRPKRLRPPGFIVPCQPVLAPKVPEGDGWLHELKHDGSYHRIRRARRSGCGAPTAGTGPPRWSRSPRPSWPAGHQDRLRWRSSRDSSMSGKPETSPGGRRRSRNEEAGMGFRLDPREIGWAPYAMIGGGFGLGLLVLAIAMFLKHA